MWCSTSRTKGKAQEGEGRLLERDKAGAVRRAETGTAVERRLVGDRKLGKVLADHWAGWSREEDGRGGSEGAVSTLCCARGGRARCPASLSTGQGQRGTATNPQHVLALDALRLPRLSPPCGTPQLPRRPAPRLPLFGWRRQRRVIAARCGGKLSPPAHASNSPRGRSGASPRLQHHRHRLRPAAPRARRTRRTHSRAGSRRC